MKLATCQNGNRTWTRLRRARFADAPGAGIIEGEQPERLEDPHHSTTPFRPSAVARRNRTVHEELRPTDRPRAARLRDQPPRAPVADQRRATAEAGVGRSANRLTDAACGPRVGVCRVSLGLDHFFLSGHTGIPSQNQTSALGVGCVPDVTQLNPTDELITSAFSR